MTTLGFHASHEQFAPSALLDYVRLAEQAGFDAAMCSDHIAPWSERQGESGFAWSWLGAAMQSTALPFGVVNAPGERYHPAIIAQAAATLAEMFSGRFWVALGTGQAINEHITGAPWPPKPQRNARLRECVDIIRALWAGETVTHRGLVTVEEARLWSLPDQAPMIVGPALTPETAEFAGGWADAFITVHGTRDQMQRMVDAFRRGGGEGKPLYLQVHLSFAESDDEALANAYDQWRTPIFPGIVNEYLQSPAQLEAAARFVDPEDVASMVRVSSSLEQHIEWLSQDLELGFDHLYLHNVGRNQEHFIERFGADVLPRLR